MALARHMGHDSVVEILAQESPCPNAQDILAFVKLPKPARTQIFAIGLEQFQVLEAVILQEIDALVFGQKGSRAWEMTTSCSDPLILGLCIRRLALWYRQMMFSYKSHGVCKSFPDKEFAQHI
jgi:hypothetical protein